MNRLTNRQLLFRLTFLVVLLLTAAWLPQARGECLAGTAADTFEAERAGLSREWILQLPFESNGYRLGRVDVGRWTVVAQSGDGKVHAVRAGNAATVKPGLPRPGTLLWSTSLGIPLAPPQPAGIDGQLVVVTHDMEAVGLQARTGSIFWRRQMPVPPSAGGLPVGNWVYVPLRNATVLRLPANPFGLMLPEPGGEDSDDGTGVGSEQLIKLDPIEINSHGLIEQQPFPYSGGVIWCTRNGHLTAIEQAANAWARHEFELLQAPGGPVLVRDQTIFATTVTGELIRFEDAPGGLRLNWRSLLETSLHPNEQRPQLLLKGETLIVSLGEGGIAAHAADSGQRLWKSPLKAELLAIVGDLVWCYDRQNMLTGLSLTDGERKASLNPGPFTLPVTNRASERLILASPRGLLASLGPRLVAGEQPPSAADAEAPTATAEPPAELPKDSEKEAADEPFNFFGS
jgi:outer membrane protein assembly factor BamB